MERSGDSSSVPGSNVRHWRENGDPLRIKKLQHSDPKRRFRRGSAFWGSLPVTIAHGTGSTARSRPGDRFGPGPPSAYSGLDTHPGPAARRPRTLSESGDEDAVAWIEGLGSRPGRGPGCDGLWRRRRATRKRGAASERPAALDLHGIGFSLACSPIRDPRRIRIGQSAGRGRVRPDRGRGSDASRTRREAPGEPRSSRRGGRGGVSPEGQRRTNGP